MTTKVNHDAHRAAVLKQMHQDRLKAAAKAKKDAEAAEKLAVREANIVSDAKTT